MIIFDLICRNDHRFEGWFRDAADFDGQLCRRLINCPQCETPEVRRVPSAVAIASHSLPPAVAGGRAREVGAGGHEAVSLRSGSQLLAAYREFVRLLRENSEDVGDSFVEEARRIHYLEAPERAIRGNATPQQCADLEDEGISVIAIPVVKGEDLN